MLGELLNAKKPVPFPIAIDEVATLAGGYPQPYATLFRVCYLYGARVGEALHLCGKDFNLTKDSYGRPALVAHILTEKNRKTPLRVIPALAGAKDSLTPFQQVEVGITKDVLAYLEGVKNEDMLFPSITRQLAHYYFSKQAVDVRALIPAEKKIIDLPGFKLHPHYLRHVRLTHLVEEYGYSHVALMQYAGWTDIRPAAVYLQLDWRHLAEQMKPGNWLGAVE